MTHFSSKSDVYQIKYPDTPLPLLFDSPHSGRHYPEDFHYGCDFRLLQGAEDNHVDELFASTPRHGGALLTALFPRTYIDVNRAVTDIDTGLLAEKWPGPLRPGSRSHAGIGLIRRLVRPGVPVYDRKLTAAEIRHRIENYYQPYHEALAALLDEAHYNFGEVWHINAHSMPSLPGQPDFVLGDRDGTSCAPAFTHALRDFIKSLGYRVTVNHPYKGVEILRRHAAPAKGRHSLQLEIAKALYWNEKENKKSQNFSALAGDIEKIVEFCAGWTRSRASQNLAAD